MNKVILIGRLTKDPELRKTPTDISVVQFSIAVNRSYQNKNGEKQADFINCIAWRNQAENLARYIKKGGLIAVEGQIQTRTYDDANGVRKYITEVLAETITFLESKKADSGFNDFSQLDIPPVKKEPSHDSSSQKNPFEDLNGNFEFSNDDLPF